MTDSQQPELTEDGRQRRTIKSFVMRAGRMTEGQQKGLDQGTPLFVLPLADAPVDFDQVFGRSAPRSLEIGFGMGHSLLEMAAAAPEQDFIGMPRLTVRMAARIQGFPDHWQISGKKTPAYRQIGNAFPPPVACAVGTQIRAALNAAAKPKLKRAQ